MKIYNLRYLTASKKPKDKNQTIPKCPMLNPNTNKFDLLCINMNFMPINISTKKYILKWHLINRKKNIIKIFQINKFKIIGNALFKIRKDSYKTKSNGLLPEDSKNLVNKKLISVLCPLKTPKMII